MNKAYLLRCSSCGTLNRVPAEKADNRPLCGRCRKTLEFPSSPVLVTSGNFERDVLEWPGLVLAEFFDEWCYYCQQIDPELKRLASERQGRLKIVKIDVKNDPVLALRYDAKGTPTFLLFRSGKELGRLDGAPASIHELEQWIYTSTLKKY